MTTPTTPDSFETTIANVCEFCGVTLDHMAPRFAACDGLEMIRFHRDEDGCWHAGTSHISAHTAEWTDDWAPETDELAAALYQAVRVDAEDLDEDAGDYVVVGPEWGEAEVTQDEDRAACARMETYLDDHAPVGYSFRVRRARQGEAAGTYLDLCTGTLQILGYSLPVSERVREMVDAAYAHALETWDAPVPSYVAVFRGNDAYDVFVDRVDSGELIATGSWGGPHDKDLAGNPRFYAIGSGEDRPAVIEAVIRARTIWERSHPTEPEPKPETDTMPTAPKPIRAWVQQIIDYIDEHIHDWTGCAWTEILTRDVPVDDDIIELSLDIDGVDPDDYVDHSARADWAAEVTQRTRLARDTVARDGCPLITHADALVVQAVEKARSIRDDAQSARFSAGECRLALDRFLRGDGREIENAAKAARRARDIEADYGDAPTWGWLADQTERLYQMAEEAHDTGQWEIEGPMPKANMLAIAMTLLATAPPPVHGDELHVRVETRWIDARPGSDGFSPAYNGDDPRVLLLVKDAITGTMLRVFYAWKGSDEVSDLGPALSWARTDAELSELDDALEGRR